MGATIMVMQANSGTSSSTSSTSAMSNMVQTSTSASLTSMMQTTTTPSSPMAYNAGHRLSAAPVLFTTVFTLIALIFI